MDKYAAAALLSAEKRKREIEKAYYDRCDIAVEEHFQTYNDLSLEQIKKILKDQLT